LHEFERSGGHLAIRADLRSVALASFAGFSHKQKRMKVAFISGTSIVRSNLFDGWREETLPTPHGTVAVRTRDDLLVLNRHGFGTPRPPHAINHRANIGALRAWGAAEVVSLNSVGSLREELPPGTFVSCDDYVSFTPATFHDDALASQAPVVPNRLLPRLLEGFAPPVHRGKVYVQMRGPRFETRAEIRIIRTWGDVVGMTMASEADLAQEAGIGYNSICMVDNFAHGLTPHDLSQAEFQRLVKTNQEKVNALVSHLVRILSNAM
jgi:purine nucleoside phosphorylase